VTDFARITESSVGLGQCRIKVAEEPCFAVEIEIVAGKFSANKDIAQCNGGILGSILFAAIAGIRCFRVA
jgi:hypothetical protein